jgi:hypothetical protein
MWRILLAGNDAGWPNPGVEFGIEYSGTRISGRARTPSSPGRRYWQMAFIIAWMVRGGGTGTVAVRLIFCLVGLHSPADRGPRLCPLQYTYRLFGAKAKKDL